jgi:hypothetical protein
MDILERGYRLYISNNEINVTSGTHLGTHGKRGKMIGFSRKSRARLMRFLNSVVFDSALFVTLTYRYNQVDDKRAYKDLREFHRLMSRSCGNVGCLWRKEYQERGAVHYHLFLFDAPSGWNRESIRDCWMTVTCQEGDYASRRYGTHVKEIDTLKADDGGVVFAYMAKYTAKAANEAHGRSWGCLGTSCIRQTGQTYVLTEFQASALVEYLKKQGSADYPIDGGGVGVRYYGRNIGNASKPVALSLVGQGAMKILETEVQYLISSTAI